MSVDELKAEAKRHGYALIKRNPLPKKLPCVCGRKLLEEWYVVSRKGWMYKCPVCGRMADMGKTEREARELWNEAVEKWKKMKAEVAKNETD